MYSFLSHLTVLFLKLVLVFLTLVKLVVIDVVHEIVFVIWIFEIMYENRINSSICACAHVHVHTDTGVCWLLSPYLAYFVLKSNYSDAESIC